MKENVIKDNIYGPKFRKMRVAHHINLVDVAKGITNKSTLAEWEKGKDNLSWCKVIALLFNIHVQPMEFLENTVSSHLYFSIQDIADAYGANNIKQLKAISLQYLKRYQDRPLNKKDLPKAESLLEKLDTLEIMNLYAEETIRKKFMHSLIDYAKNNDSTEIASLFKYLDFLGLKNMKSDFQVAFTQIKQIYGE